jgi:ATP-dependent protease HslVU (ClpYQ) peptidase subunit
MSVAVAVQKGRTIAIAADTQENFGDRRVLRGDHSSSKIMKVGGSYVAQTGWGLYENILGDYLGKAGTPRLRNEREIFVFFNRFWKRMRKDYSFVNDQPMEDDKSPFADLDASFLIVNAGGIFHVTGQMSVTRFNRFDAIGSGGPYALGALHTLYDGTSDAAEIARRACAAAVHFDISCGGALDVFTIKLQGSRRA